MHPGVKMLRKFLDKVFEVVLFIVVLLFGLNIMFTVSKVLIHIAPPM